MITPSVAIEHLIAAGVARVDLHNAQPFRTSKMTLADTVEARSAELISHFMRREQELLAANSAYLERMRTIEANTDWPILQRTDGRYTIVLLQDGKLSSLITWSADTVAECLAWADSMGDPWIIGSIVISKAGYVHIGEIEEKQPLTAADLADALGAFWNASLSSVQASEADAPYAVVGSIAEGLAAVAATLRQGRTG